ncbi:Protein sensitivity to red light reduced 1 [Vitis vinifera]|uniref:Protein sensitivity to red light reduced 1 n=1 Tax=Vitis vinifera TaxID=29760 RepID=A0A438GJ25_VITVI|nr:Protein sensitivity to red light reduced 1 [Vitis vinifera]
MAASAKTITLDSSNIISDWTVVLPCCADFEMDHHRETKLMQKVQICIEKLENSTFYHVLLDQVQTPHMLEAFFRPGNLAEKKVQLDWGDRGIGSNSFSDRIRVLEALGCSVLSVNEKGWRQASKPTPFFMPHCEAELYDNLVQAKWRTERLNNIVLFGNNFGTYEQHVSEFRSSTLVDSSRHILAVRKFTCEFAIKVVSDYYFGAFHDSSWHFLSLDA